MSSLPISLYESLLTKLATVLELTQRPEGTVSTQSRADLLKATNDFKSSLNRAKELAVALPGGELVVAEQDQVIAMLEQLREIKREHLAQFSARTVASTTSAVAPGGITGALDRMEIDSMASTPMY